MSSEKQKVYVVLLLTDGDRFDRPYSEIFGDCIYQFKDEAHAAATKIARSMGLRVLQDGPTAEHFSSAEKRWIAVDSYLVK